MDFNYCRRFGVEIEINSFDNLDRPPPDRKLPYGIYYVGNLIVKSVKDYVEVRKWGHTNWERTNGFWVVKPDHSCGIEICSPVMKGWLGTKEICKVIDALSRDSNIAADTRCSLHLHVNVGDLEIKELINVLKFWIKCEPVFIDAVPDYRKNNRYCQLIGLWDWLQDDSNLSPNELIKLLSDVKYTTLNTYHFYRSKRPTIEFRIPENTACLNSYVFKNWIRLLTHFVEMAKETNSDVVNFDWLDPNDVFNLLGFKNSNLSFGMRQLRDWFLARLLSNIKSNIGGVFSMKAKSIAIKQVLNMVKDQMKSSSFSLAEILNPSDLCEATYDVKYVT